jgi:hypothetical protein
MCAQGTMQCRAGGLECVPVQQPAEEKCNAMDDNCDGQVDEGNNLCPRPASCGVWVAFSLAVLFGLRRRGRLHEHG